MKEYTATEQAYKNGYEAGKPKWIPVTEKLPEKDGSVLVYNGYGRGILWFEKGNGFNEIDDYGWVRPVDSVTHWMPLPEPPKNEREEQNGNNKD